MGLLQKVSLLGAAGKWDICASSASPRQVSINSNTKINDTIGNAACSGICHSFSENGRCVSLFKTLLTNSCSYDCKYCQNSTSCKSSRIMYEPEELSKVFMHLYLSNHVEGLFLSSGIIKDADFTTQKMLDAVNLIRKKYNFRGYIHFKIIPGTSYELVKQACEISDRVSINLELPNSSRLSEVSSVKDYSIDILRRQSWLKNMKLPAGHTTQFVVGSCNEKDEEILRMVNWEYQNMKLKRAYFSAFTPIKGTPLQENNKIPLEREHRLYNVDFMIRKYHFKIKEFNEIMNDGMLPHGDPKIHLAKNYFDNPIDINTASYDELLHVPGIGPQSAFRIISLQEKHKKLTSAEQIKNIGVVIKRAVPFLKINGNKQTTLASY